MVLGDKSQQKTVSLRVSVTDRCQCACSYCRSARVRPAAPRTRLEAADLLRFVRVLASQFGVSKVHLTGGEPLLHEEIVDVVRMLAGEDVSELVLTSNGQRLEEYAGPLRQAGLDRVNVSLDTLDAATSRRLGGAGASLSRTLAGVKAALAAGLNPVKLNTVVLRDYNADEVCALARWAVERACPIRFIELMPVGCIRDEFPGQFVSSEEVRRRLREEFRLIPFSQEPGASSRMYCIECPGAGTGQVGFISSVSEPFCEGCRRLRLMSDGRLLGCLKEPAGTPILDLLRADGPKAHRDLLELVHELLRSKGCGRSFEGVETLLARGG
jgi:cyclic pyranopterin phosphate synthase